MVSKTSKPSTTPNALLVRASKYITPQEIQENADKLITLGYKAWRKKTRKKEPISQKEKLREIEETLCQQESQQERGEDLT